MMQTSPHRANRVTISSVALPDAAGKRRRHEAVRIGQSLEKGGGAGRSARVSEHAPHHMGSVAKRSCARGKHCTQYRALGEPAKLRTTSQSDLCERCLQDESGLEGKVA